jgi:hypothetical protein
LLPVMERNEDKTAGKHGGQKQHGALELAVA